jgi:hypothetical protein
MDEKKVLLKRAPLVARDFWCGGWNPSGRLGHHDVDEELADVEAVGGELGAEALEGFDAESGGRLFDDVDEELPNECFVRMGA